MENTQTKSSKQSMKPISSFYKHSCESCNYYTNYKNSYNKHIKSAKHLSLNPVNSIEETEDLQTNAVDNEVDKETAFKETEVEVVMDASMGFITVEEIKRDTTSSTPNKNERFLDNEDKLSQIVDLMNGLNKSVENDLKIKYFFTGMGFFFNFVLCNFLLYQLFVRS